MTSGGDSSNGLPVALGGGGGGGAGESLWGTDFVGSGTGTVTLRGDLKSASDVVFSEC